MITESRKAMWECATAKYVRTCRNGLILPLMKRLMQVSRITTLTVWGRFHPHWQIKVSAKYLVVLLSTWTKLEVLISRSWQQLATDSPEEFGVLPDVEWLHQGVWKRFLTQAQHARSTEKSQNIKNSISISGSHPSSTGTKSIKVPAFLFSSVILMT